MFEPLMLVFLGVVIGMMVIGMFLPIFQIATIAG
jgi:type II secretory pathway component PulF